MIHGKVAKSVIYYTGDIHGQKYEIARFCKRFNLTREDTVVILGDVGANYCGDERGSQYDSGESRKS